MRKPAFGVCDQVRLKLVCSARETSWCIEILDLASIGNILPRQRTTKAQIRHTDAQADLRLCCLHNVKRFSHDRAH